jgi:hypothetical protein
MVDRVLNRAETWEIAYTAFQQINFTAWDFDTIKKSLLDYLKLYYPEEDFNDYIESSELVAILELFAYVGEMVAYRQDMNAHESIITQADRKESVLRLAKLLSYNASRNLPARGLVKIASISTTEQVFDSRGNDLTNITIYWNDQNNDQWKDQFLIVMNRVLSQNFGSVLPSDRVQVQDVIFELYGLNNNPLNNNVLSYTINVSGSTYPMEIVSSQLNDNGPYEKRPELNLQMNILYLSDGLGDSSDNTGFFFFTKQGQLQKTTTVFDGVTPNQTFDILINNSNDTDVWVNNVDAKTDIILVGDGSTTTRAGEWEQVDVANSQNIIFNTNPNRNKYEIETLNNDQFRLIFGDGNFSNIPSGTFDIWSRTSANDNIVIPANAIQNISSGIPYADNNGKKQTLTFAFSLVDSIQNAAPSEDIEHIRRVAPAVYYTQDRMVNGQDYNEFMLQDNSILKLRAINRTFAGDSKYIEWHDPREYYDNVKMFSDDGVIYFNEYIVDTRIGQGSLPAPDYGANVSLTNALILNYIEPILSTDEFYIKAILRGVNPVLIRTKFQATERAALAAGLSKSVNAAPQTVYLNFDVPTNAWQITLTEPVTYWISIELQTDNYWDIQFLAQRIIIHSDGLDFWITNNSAKTITYDTLNGNYDQIIVLAANVDPSGNILTANYTLNAVEQYVYETGENKGLESINDLLLLPGDSTGDGIPDFVTLSYLINPSSLVYFTRLCVNGCEWTYVPYSSSVVASYLADQANGTGLWKAENGRENINFLWLHRTPRYHLVDPAPSNIIDSYIISRGYYTLLRQWLTGKISNQPVPPTPFELKNSYGYLLESKMITDELILHPGIIKLVFGKYADNTLQASFKVVRSQNKTLSNNQIKTSIVDAINTYFDINNWEFGQTFYFTDLASYIHNSMPSDISSVVLVPTYNTHIFGDMFQVYAKENEIIQPSIDVSNIDIVDSLTPQILRQF